MNLGSKLSTVAGADAVRAALDIVDRNGYLPAEQLVAGVSILFSAISRHTGLSVAELLDKAARYCADGDLTSGYSALTDYVKEEIR